MCKHVITYLYKRNNVYNPLYGNYQKLHVADAVYLTKSATYATHIYHVAKLNPQPFWLHVTRVCQSITTAFCVGSTNTTVHIGRSPVKCHPLVFGLVLH